MITVESSGSFKNIDRFLNSMKEEEIFSTLDRYGRIGVYALSDATPVDSGITANSWTYEVIKTRKKYEIVWRNENINSGIPIAILIQYGHATRDGGWVEGRDYINPTIQPLFDKIANEVWERVKRA
jgi:hypothetical protein